MEFLGVITFVASLTVFVVFLIMASNIGSIKTSTHNTDARLYTILTSLEKIVKHLEKNAEKRQNQG